MPDGNPKDKDAERRELVRAAGAAGGDVQKLQQYVKALKELQKGLKKEDDLYKALAKDAKRLETVIVRLNKSKSNLAKVADSLTTKLGSSGVSGVITKFTAGTASAATSVNRLDGTMSILGRTTNITAKTFMGWLSALQLVISGVVRLMDELDKAQIKQANLQRAFGATNISLQESFRAVSAGWVTAGKAGAEAAPKLNEAARAARARLLTELGGVQGRGFQRLIEYQVGLDPKTIERFRELTMIFNIRTGGNLLAQLDNVYDIAVKSGLPMERYVDLIFNLGKEFADVGMKIDDAAASMAMFEEAVNQQRVTMGLAAKMGNLAMTQQLRAGGFQGRLLTAAFVQDMWDQMPGAVTDEINKVAKEKRGMEFREMDAYEASNLLARMDVDRPGLYTQAMRGSYLKLMEIEKERGWGAAEQMATTMGFGEWREFRRAFAEAGPEGPTREQLQEVMMTADERQMAAAKKQLEAGEAQVTAAELAKTNAELNQQWYSEWAAFWNKALGTLLDALPEGEKIFEKVQEGTAWALTGGGYGVFKYMGIQQSEAWTRILEKFHGFGEHAPQFQEWQRGFKEEYGIPYERLQEYMAPGGAQERGEPLRVHEGEANVEVLKGKFANIRVEVVDSPTGEEVGGTKGGE